MISEVVAGVLVDVIAGTGRMLGVTVLASSDQRHYGGDLAIARWFDTYRLTSEAPDLPELPGESAGQLAGVLQSYDVQAVLHELLAARLTDAAEADVEQIRTEFSVTLRTADPEFSRIERALFEYFDGEICDMTGRLEGANPKALAQIRGEALSARMIAILNAIERHTASLSSQPQRRDASDFIGRYRRHVLEYHGQIEPPDFERRRRVPIASLYVAPSIVQLVDIQPSEQPREIDLPAVADEVDRAVLLGDPGSGKTTSANVLMYFQASDDQRRIPFIVTLREYAASNPPERSVVTHIEHRLEVFYQCPAPAGVLSRLLLTGAAIVIFDGLDELLDTAHRADVAAVIERFCTEYPLVPVLVTSRLVGYDQARLDDRQFARYRIQGFGEDRVREYVAKWFAQEKDIKADQAATWAEEFMSESGSVPDLRASPLMLALMCILYRGEGSLPRNRAEVYEQCAGLLFRKWDARRRIHLELRAGHLVEPAIRHLAWWLITRGSAEPAVTRNELLKELSAFLSGRGFESEADAREAAAEFVDFCKGRMWVLSDAGTTGSGEALYSFTHRTFLEFFAAAHLAYSCDTPEQLARTLAPRLARHEWEVLSELAVQIKDNSSDQGAQRVYAALLGERRRRSSNGRSGVLQFLARCLRSADPSPRTVRELARAILDHVFADMPNVPVSYTPLIWLIASCTNCRDVVSDEIGKRISAMTGSVDPSVHLNGLRLALWSHYSLWASASPATRPTISPSLGKFWKEYAAELTRSYSDAIVAAADADSEMRYGGLLRHLLTVDQALEMPGGLLPLMQIQETGVFAITWASYLVGSAVHFCEESRGADDPDETHMRKYIDDFSAVGRHLLRNPNPPWINGAPQSWSDFASWGNKADGYGRFRVSGLDTIAYLGAAAVLLTSTEGNKIKLLPQGPEQLGALGDLYYYIATRWNAAPGIELPVLPVPDSFRQVFDDWANGTVNFSGSGLGVAWSARRS